MPTVGYPFSVFFSTSALCNHPEHKAQPLKQWLNTQETQHHFSPQPLAQLIHQASINPQVIAHMNHPYEALPWHTYKHHFVTEQRILDGRTFQLKQKKALQRAQKIYHVNPRIITAIVGMESNYGQVHPHYNELNTLVTLAFHYPSRASFFQKELSYFLQLTRKYQMDTKKILGSYAGALGIPQFMPSNYFNLAVPYTPNSPPNLLNNPNDAIVTVAHMFARNGWQQGQPIAIPVTPIKAIPSYLINLKGKATTTVPQLLARKLFNPQQDKALRLIGKNHNKVGILVEQVAGKKMYWLTLKNFRVVMEYNNSPLYALTAFTLSQQKKPHIISST